MTNPTPAVIAGGLSATQKTVLTILAERRFYPRMIVATRAKLLELGLVESGYGDSVRATDLGRAVAAELQKRA